MGPRQGRIRLQAGISRQVTRHEVARGYLYLTRDRDFHEIFSVADFEMQIDATVLAHRHIDQYGRVYIGSILKAMCPTSIVHIQMVSPTRITLRVNEAEQG